MLFVGRPASGACWNRRNFGSCGSGLRSGPRSSLSPPRKPKATLRTALSARIRGLARFERSRDRGCGSGRRRHPVADQRASRSRSPARGCSRDGIRQGGPRPDWSGETIDHGPGGCPGGESVAKGGLATSPGEVAAPQPEQPLPPPPQLAAPSASTGFGTRRFGLSVGVLVSLGGVLVAAAVASPLLPDISLVSRELQTPRGRGRTTANRTRGRPAAVQPGHDRRAPRGGSEADATGPRRAPTGRPRVGKSELRHGTPPGNRASRDARKPAFAA